MNGFAENIQSDEKLSVEFWEMISTINHNLYVNNFLFNKEHDQEKHSNLPEL
jgi:hypothetical protein